jgi:hypothetical protein
MTIKITTYSKCRPLYGKNHSSNSNFGRDFASFAHFNELRNKKKSEKRLVNKRAKTLLQPAVFLLLHTASFIHHPYGIPRPQLTEVYCPRTWPSTLSFLPAVPCSIYSRSISSSPSPSLFQIHGQTRAAAPFMKARAAAAGEVLRWCPSEQQGGQKSHSSLTSQRRWERRCTRLPAGAHEAPLARIRLRRGRSPPSPSPSSSCPHLSLLQCRWGQPQWEVRGAVSGGGCRRGRMTTAPRRGPGRCPLWRPVRRQIAVGGGGLVRARRRPSVSSCAVHSREG